MRLWLSCDDFPEQVPHGHGAEGGHDTDDHKDGVGVDQVSDHLRNPRTMETAEIVMSSARPRIPAPNWSASSLTSWTLGAAVCVTVTVGWGVGSCEAVGSGVGVGSVEVSPAVGEGAGVGSAVAGAVETVKGAIKVIGCASVRGCAESCMAKSDDGENTAEE